MHYRNRWRYMAVLLTASTIITGTYVATEPNKGANEPIETSVEEIAESEVETAETDEIRCETVYFECVMGAPPTESQEIEQNIQEAEDELYEAEDVSFPTYTVDGQSLDPDLNEFIRVTISSMGHPEWEPYILCQIYQESRFDPYAENPNGQDKGLLQFRLRYWNWNDGDIFDPYAQLRVYLRRWKERSDAGWDIYSIISAHYTGGVKYSEQYVSDVMQWMGKVETK